MTLKVLAVEPIHSGLNNQRLALLGLFEIARERSAAVRLPDEVYDFIPVPKGAARISPMTPIWEILDKETFMAAVQGCPLSTDAPAETLTMQECFTRGARTVRRAGPGSFAERFILGFRAARPLRDLADHITHFVEDHDAFALQLRIERDWREYILRKTGTLEAVTDNEHLTVDPAVIFAKCAATPHLAKFKAIWACCDEDDLTLSKTEIKAAGASHGYQILFKTDLPQHVELPASRLRRSMIDFEVCLSAQAYVGLGRSTFSNTQDFIANANGDRRTQFRYDLPGDRCESRAPAPINA